MAEKKANLIIELVDKFAPGLKKMEAGLTTVKNAVSEFKLSLLAITAAIAGVVGTISIFVKAYLESEVAVNKLNTALKNQGLFTEETSKELQAYATSLANVTTFTDESIVETMAALTSFGLAGDELKKVTKAALDLSVGLGVDLKTATLLLGKAAVGETGALSRFGISIKENIPPAEKLTAIIEQVNTRWGGEAQAQLNTTAGKLQNFHNRLSEFKELIGKLIIPVIDFFLSKLMSILMAFEQIINSEASITRFFITLAQLFLEVGRSIIQTIIEPFEKLAPVLSKLGIDIQKPIAEINAFFDSQIAKLEEKALAAEEASSREVMAESDKLDAMNQMTLTRQQFLDEQAAIEAERERKAAEQKAERERKAAADKAARDKKATEDAIKEKERQKAADEEFAKQKEALETNLWAKLMGLDKARTVEELKRSEERARNTESTLSFISQLTNSKNRELFAIGKAAAIAGATADTYAAAAKALRATPWPPANIAMAAAVIATGLANVARIQSTHMAEGGVVLPRAGGTLATLGEAGRAEAVIPLEDEVAKDKLRDLGGGDTVNIVINAGTLVADELSVRAFAEKIDEELFRLQRNRRSVAF